jgi:hypothetical protein
MTVITKNAALILLTALLLAGASSCIMEDRTVEFVVTEETCAPFNVDSPSVTFEETAPVFLADDLNEVLSDNDAAREDIVTARIVSLSYSVTQFSHTHDWDITGAVTVERQDVTDGPDTLLNYTDQSVQGALGVKIPADLNADGVDLINRALDDFVAGGNPVLIFKVVNGGVNPPPNASDHNVFQWEPCLVTHIVVKKDIEVPDPF